MKQIILLVVFLLGFVGFAQDLETIKVVEKINGFKKTKKEYYVLKDNPKVKHGEYKEYYKKHLVVDGTYKMGEKDGQWMYKDPEGNYMQKGKFKDGEEVGGWERFFDGKLVGETFYDDESNILNYSGMDLKGNLLGEYIYDELTKTGKGFELNLYDLKIEYTTYGKKRLYDGSVKIFYPNGALFQEKKYDRGKLFWASDIYRNDGSVERKVTLINGTGQDIGYYMNKLVEKDEFIGKTLITYKDSIPNGKAIWFNQEGKVVSVGYKFKNKKIGEWKEWSRNKKKLVAKKYKNLTQELKDKNYLEQVKNKFDGVSKGPIMLMENMKSEESYEFHKKKFSEILNRFVAKKVDTKYLASLLGSSSFRGVHRISCMFRINNYGEIRDVKIKAKRNKKLVKEYIEEVLEKLPTFVPAHKDYHYTNILFSLPIVFRLD